MALDELHARRLETVATLLEAALDRIELLLRHGEEPGGASRSSPRFTPQIIRNVRQDMARIRRRLEEGFKRLSITRHRLDPRQVLAAELASLSVVLENALPKHLKGYGREFDPADRKEWEELIHDLLSDVEQIRKDAAGREAEARPARL